MVRAQITMTQMGVVAPAGMVPLAIRASVMMPMVFCASLVPWASETSEAEPIWPMRKPAPRLRSCMDRAIR